MKIPIIYQISHYILGALSYHYIFILPLFLLYQIFQYLFGIRYFLLTNTIKRGNSIQHTTFKIAQFLLGYIFIYLIVNIN